MMGYGRRHLTGIVLLCLFMVVFCNGSRAYAALAVSSTNINMKVGTFHSFSISGGSGFYKISSSDDAVAAAAISGSTGNKGTVQGISQGTAVITIEDSTGATVSIDVQVSEITLSKDSIALLVQETQTITVLTSSGYYNVVSSDTSVASVAVAGDTISITGVTAGTAILTVSDSNNNAASITVTVGTGFSISPASLDIQVGDTADADLSKAGVYMVASSDTDVATAVISGTTLTVTGVAQGTAVITVQNNTGFSDTLNITVTPPSTVSLTQTIKIGIGQTDTVSFTGGSGFYQVNIADVNVVSVTVVGNDIAVLGLAQGNTTITIQDNAGSQLIIDVSVSDIALTKNTVTLLVQETQTIDILAGSNFYNVSSSNPQVASASLSGNSIVITGVSPGSATLTVIDSNADTAAVTVTVWAPSQTQLDLSIAETATVSLAGGSGFYQVNIADPAIAEVVMAKDTAVITALDSGKTSIYITDSLGKIFEYEVLVKLEAPILNVSVTGTLVELWWDPVPHAGSYVIYYAPPDANGDADLSNIFQANLGSLEKLILDMGSKDHYFAALLGIHMVHADIVSVLSNIVEVQIP